MPQNLRTSYELRKERRTSILDTAQNHGKHESYPAAGVDPGGWNG